MTDSQMLLLALIFFFGLIFLGALAVILKSDRGNLLAILVLIISAALAVGCLIYQISNVFALF